MQSDVVISVPESSQLNVPTRLQAPSTQQSINVYTDDIYGTKTGQDGFQS